MTHRLRPHQIAGSELAAPPDDGDVLTWDSTDDEARWAAPTGGGGSGRSLDRRWNVGPAETSIDEFDDGSIGGSWVAVYDTGGSGRLTWTEAEDQLIATNTGGDTGNQFSALLLPLSGIGGSLATGDAFITCVSIGSNGANHAFSGLLFSDGTAFGSGNQLVATTHAGAASADHVLRTYTGFTTNSASASSISGVRIGTPWFLRLVYLGGTTFRRDVSEDGKSWRIGATMSVASFTPTHVGVLSSSFGTATAHQLRYEFLRRVAGIT